MLCPTGAYDTTPQSHRPPRSAGDARGTALWAAAVLVALGSLSGSVAADVPAASASPASAQESSAPTITIEARKRRDLLEHQISHFVSSITINSFDESLATWKARICPLVAGLRRDMGEFILARLSQDVGDAGAPLGSPSCRSANLFIVFTPYAKALLHKWWARYPRTFNTDRGTGVLRHLIDTDQAVRVWYNAFSGCAEGQGTLKLGNASNGSVALSCRVPGIGTRISWQDGAVLRNIESVIVVVDSTRLAHVNIGQLTDYIAMMSLAQIRVKLAPSDTPTILRLFSDAGAARLPGLSSWDRAYLHALYHTDPRLVMQVSEIEQKMLQTLAP